MYWVIKVGATYLRGVKCSEVGNGIIFLFTPNRCDAYKYGSAFVAEMDVHTIAAGEGIGARVVRVKKKGEK